MNGSLDYTGTRAVSAQHTVDLGALQSWLERHLDGFAGPLSIEMFKGGQSNPTYKLITPTRAYVMRAKPGPVAKLLPSAHAIEREFRVMSALRATDVPVAQMHVLCEDESVIGRAFYVMEFVEGPVLRGLAEAEAFPDEADRRAIGERVADTLVAIHAVDPDAAGLGDLGRKQDYVARQLRRWHGQWEQSKTRELAAIDAVHERLSARIPEQGPATIVHGDYRLDNMILTPAGEVAAVVDWELCTLGDPLADVGLLLVYWPDSAEDLALGQPANLAPGFPSRAELASRYAERSGRDLSQIDFYVALGYWKLAIILEGVYARYTAGGYGKVDPGVEQFARLVERLAEAAEQSASNG